MLPCTTRFCKAGATLVFIALTGCLGEYFNPLDQEGLRVVVLPLDTTVFVGSQYQARGLMFNSFGDLYPSDHIELSGMDPVAIVSQSGTVTGVTPGRARVIGRRGDLADTSYVSVVPPGSIALGLEAEQAVVVTADLDGSSLTSIVTAGQASGAAPAWLPSGDGIVYQEMISGGAGSSLLYVTDLSGNRRRLLPVSAEFPDEKFPRMSRDGAWVYFRLRKQGTPEAEIWRIHLDGSGLELVGAPASAGGDNTHPDPSPDGARLAFVTARLSPGTLSVVVRDLGTGAERALGPGGLPRWSPAGDWIAYLSSLDFFHATIFLVRPDGTENHQVSLIGRNYQFKGLDWSPDGQWLLARSDETIDLVHVSTGLTLPLEFTRDYDWASFKPQQP